MYLYIGINCHYDERNFLLVYYFKKLILFEHNNQMLSLRNSK